MLNLSARYRPTPRIQWFAHVDNVFDRRYSNAALLGETAFDAQGRFVARPFPAVDGEFPLRNSTFFAPGLRELFLWACATPSNNTRCFNFFGTVWHWPAHKREAARREA